MCAQFWNFPSVHAFDHPSIHTSIHPSTHLSIHPPIRPPTSANAPHSVVHVKVAVMTLDDVTLVLIVAHVAELSGAREAAVTAVPDQVDPDLALDL